MNKQEMEQKALALHVSAINDTMLRMINNLASEIVMYKERDCLCRKCNRGFRQMLLLAHTFRHDFLDKHPSNYQKSSVTFPYNILLATQLYEKINEALELAPVIVPRILYQKWNESLSWLEQASESEEGHEDINVQ